MTFLFEIIEQIATKINQTVDFFLLQKNYPKIIMEGQCKKMKIFKQELQFEKCLKQRIEIIC